MNSSPNAALSPKSSILSAEYEKKSIKSLKAEIKGLTRAVNAFSKDSPEYRHLKPMLDIAKEDLNCLLEDQYMFRSFTGSGNNSSINNVHETSSDIDRSFSSTTSISTPPLSRKSSTSKTKHFNIPRPPLTSSQPSTKCPEKTIDSETTWEDKYSSLWFESRMEKRASKNLTSSSSPHSPRRYSLPDKVNHSRDDDMVSKLFDSVNDKYQQRIEHLNKKLDHTSKFSKEYFTIKMEIEDIKARRRTRRRSEPTIHYVKVRI